jgi:hypothetical protein
MLVLMIAAMALVSKQQYPDIQRYLKMRSM